MPYCPQSHLLWNCPLILLAQALAHEIIPKISSKKFSFDWIFCKRENMGSSSFSQSPIIFKCSFVHQSSAKYEKLYCRILIQHVTTTITFMMTVPLVHITNCFEEHFFIHQIHIVPGLFNINFSCPMDPKAALHCYQLSGFEWSYAKTSTIYMQGTF